MSRTASPPDDDSTETTDQNWVEEHREQIEREAGLGPAAVLQRVPELVDVLVELDLGQGRQRLVEAFAGLAEVDQAVCDSPSTCHIDATSAQSAGGVAA